MPLGADGQCSVFCVGVGPFGHTNVAGLADADVDGEADGEADAEGDAVATGVAGWFALWLISSAATVPPTTAKPAIAAII